MKEIYGVKFYDGTLEQAKNELIEKIMKDSNKMIVSTFNLDYLAKVNIEPITKIVNKSDYIFADGMPIVWASKMAGKPLAERITGCDLGKEIIKASKGFNLKIFLLATDSEGRDIAERAVKNLSKDNIKIEGITQDYEFTKRSIIKDDIIIKIKKFKPDILLVGLGSPYQDEVILKYFQELPAKLFMGVGGSINVWAKTRNRAPLWMQNSGLEWLYQIYLKPKKVFRYLSNLPIFFQIIGNSIVKSFKDKF